MKKFMLMNVLCLSFAMTMNHSVYGMFGEEFISLSRRLEVSQLKLNEIELALKERELDEQDAKSRLEVSQLKLNEIELVLKQRELDRQDAAKNRVRSAGSDSIAKKRQFLDAFVKILNREEGPEATIVSKILPFIKYVSLTVQPGVMDDVFVAECDEEFLHKPEIFARISAFASCDYLNPSDISAKIAQASALNDAEKQKFAAIIHALNPGRITVKDRALVMRYDWEDGLEECEKSLKEMLHK